LGTFAFKESLALEPASRKDDERKPPTAIFVKTWRLRLQTNAKAFRRQKSLNVCAPFILLQPGMRHASKDGNASWTILRDARKCALVRMTKARSNP
jgi:hypothetical protein